MFVVHLYSSSFDFHLCYSCFLSQLPISMSNCSSYDFSSIYCLMFFTTFIYLVFNIFSQKSNLSTKPAFTGKLTIYRYIECISILVIANYFYIIIKFLLFHVILHTITISIVLLTSDIICICFPLYMFHTILE